VAALFSPCRRPGGQDLVAHPAGLLAYDDKLAASWPEFAQHGKQDITLRTLLAFQAGLCHVDQRLGVEAAYRCVARA
jgi:CubicO group peptidase (beta-lactamase class C family)